MDRDAANDEARRHLAHCLVQVGRYQEAAQHLQILLGKTPGDPLLSTLLARAVSISASATRPADCSMMFCVHTPITPRPCAERGRIALAAEKYADAENWLRQALRVLPYDYEANWGLNQALLGQGKTAEAKPQLAKVQQLKNANARIHEIQTHEMDLHPNDAALQGELGDLLAQTGQRDIGERWLLHALQLDPRLPAVHAALARLYDEKGDVDKAEEHRREANRLKANKK